MMIYKLQYFTRLASYTNVATILSVILVIYQSDPRESGLYLVKWQYHVASITCFILWVEKAYLVGKIPAFGHYIHMFR